MSPALRVVLMLGSTAGRVGGKNYTLGVIFLVYGIVLVMAAAVFRLKMLMNHRLAFLLPSPRPFC